MEKQTYASNWDQHITFIAGKGRLEEAVWIGVRIGFHILHCKSDGLAHTAAGRRNPASVIYFHLAVGAESRIQMFCGKVDPKKGRPHGNRSLGP